MANRNFLSQKMFSMRAMPVLIDCSFTVDATNANGITGLQGPLVQSILMNSSAATPTQTIAAGYIQIRLQNGYNQVLGISKPCIQSANSGSDVKIDNSAMTAGRAYTITTLGDATAAKWQAIGVPAGVTPAVGVSFIAASDGGTGDTLSSRVQLVIASSNVASIEVVGNPNKSVNPNPASQSYGSQIILVCRDYAGAIVAPSAGDVISLQILMNNSSVVASR